jgi:hypothetical protein
MNTNAGEWGMKKFGSEKSTHKTENVVTSTSKLWPNKQPNNKIKYQWKRAATNDDTQKMKLVQAAYAVAMANNKDANLILIRSATIFRSVRSTNVHTL